MDGPRSLDSIMEEALRLAGRPKTKSTPATVRNALGALRFVVQCGQGMYGPARVVLDQKALRIRLSPQDYKLARVGRTLLEPFCTVLENPPIQTLDGRPIRPILLDEEKAKEMQSAFLDALREMLGEMPLIDRYLQSVDDETILKEMDLSRVETGYYDISPALDGWQEDDDGSVDLVVRWVRERGALVVAPQRRSEVDPKGIEAEDKLLADFIASKLVGGYAKCVGPIVLEALASEDALGRTPGSPVLEVILSDPRMRIVGDETLGLQRIHVAHADRLTYGEQSAVLANQAGEWIDDMRAKLRARILEHPRRFRDAWRKAEEELGLVEGAEPKYTNVRLLRKPSNEDLVREWQCELKGAGLSQRVIQRKINHLYHFVHFLEAEANDGPKHLLDVDITTLESFFFWTYIRRWPNSKSDADTFPLDLRDFYRRQEELGRIPDARFAELIYRLRGMIQERLELYNELLVYDDEEFDELFETLFFG